MVYNGGVVLVEGQWDQTKEFKKGRETEDEDLVKDKKKKKKVIERCPVEWTTSRFVYIPAHFTPSNYTYLFPS